MSDYDDYGYDDDGYDDDGGGYDDYDTHDDYGCSDDHSDRENHGGAENHESPDSVNDVRYEDTDATVAESRGYDYYSAPDHEELNGDVASIDEHHAPKLDGCDAGKLYGHTERGPSYDFESTQSYDEGGECAAGYANHGDNGTHNEGYREDYNSDSPLNPEDRHGDTGSSATAEGYQGSNTTSSSTSELISDYKFLKPWGGRHGFMISYGIKPYDDNAYEDSRKIIDAMREAGGYGRSPFR